jgi:type II secretory pathway component GspD/PulD (secretin)
MRAFALSGLLLFCSPAFASQDPLTRTIPEISFTNADVREARRVVAKTSETNYTIDPRIQGTVTLSLTNASVINVYIALGKAVRATVRVEGGIVNFIPEANPTSELLQKEKLNLTFNGLSMGEAMTELFREFGESFVLAPEVKGTVYASLYDKTLGEMLDALASVHNFQYRVQNSVVVISKIAAEREFELITTNAQGVKWNWKQCRRTRVPFIELP